MSRVRPEPGVLCRETTKWIRDVLSDDSRAFISRLPRLIVDGELVIAHGSLADPQQYVRTPADRAEQVPVVGEVSESMVARRAIRCDADGALDPSKAGPQFVRRRPTTATESGLALIYSVINTFLEGKNV